MIVRSINRICYERTATARKGVHDLSHTYAAYKLFPSSKGKDSYKPQYMCGTRVLKQWPKRSLPDESKAVLAERIVEYLEMHVSPDLERVHLDIVKRRRDEMKDGIVQPTDGREASVMAHRIINK